MAWWKAHLGSWLEVGGECCDLGVDEFAPGETSGRLSRSVGHRRSSLNV
jgi:hypothetical protein